MYIKTHKKDNKDHFFLPSLHLFARPINKILISCYKQMSVYREKYVECCCCCWASKGHWYRYWYESKRYENCQDTKNVNSHVVASYKPIIFIFQSNPQLQIAHFSICSKIISKALLFSLPNFVLFEKLYFLCPKVCY